MMRPVTSDSGGNEPTTRLESRLPDDSRGSVGAHVLVISSNLLVAEAIASALTNLGFAARFVMPITTKHLRDFLEWQPAVALFDVESVSSTSCLSILEVLSSATVPVAVMGSRLNARLIGECIDAGASFVVDTGSPLAELASVITRLLNGQVVLDDDEKRRILAPLQREVQARRARLAPFGALTQREKCVLSELMEGHGPEAIARRGSVSVLTVRSQIKSILQKLGVNSQLAAVSLAQRAGWTFDVGELAGRRMGTREPSSRVGLTA